MLRLSQPPAVYLTLLVFTASMVAAAQPSSGSGATQGTAYYVGVIGPELSPRIENIAATEVANFIKYGTNIALYRFRSGTNAQLERRTYTKGSVALEPNWRPRNSQTTDMLRAEGLMDGGLWVFLAQSTATKQTGPGWHHLPGDKEAGERWQRVVWTAAIPEGTQDRTLAATVSALLSFSWDALADPASSLRYKEEAKDGTLLFAEQGPGGGGRAIVKTTAVRPWSVDLNNAGEFKGGYANWWRAFWRIPLRTDGHNPDGVSADALRLLKWDLAVSGEIATITRQDKPEQKLECIPVINNEAIVPLRLALQILYDGAVCDDPKAEPDRVLFRQSVFHAPDGPTVYFSTHTDLDSLEPGRLRLVKSPKKFVVEIWVP